MKKIFKTFLIFVFITLVALLPTFSVYADADEGGGGGGSSSSSSDNSGSSSGSGGGGSGCTTLLPGMKAWFCDVELNPSSTDQIETNAKQIALNVSGNIVAIAGYLTAGFVIYGGYLYISSSGDPNKTMTAKKTLTRAFIGLAIIVFAEIIISSISIAFTGASGAFDRDCVNQSCSTATELVQNAINWVIAIGGFISAIFVVVGGYNYITSSGDPNKLQKAKQTIIYACIGLLVVGLSLTITNFAINMLNAADTGKDITDPIHSLLNSIIGIASIVAIAFVIKGGAGLMLSSGNSDKAKTARQTIIYACIGLLVCALAFAIVNWTIGALKKTGSNSLNTRTIAIVQTNATINPSKNTIAFSKKLL